MNDKKVKSIFIQLQKRSETKTRKCCWQDCTEDAISSHLLQKNGVLNQIAENGNIYQLKPDHFNENLLKFTPVGKNIALTFPGFCNNHDSKIFSEIESSSIDFESYRVHLLFSYRAVVNERRKKEIIIDFYDRILGSRDLIHHLHFDAQEFFATQKEQLSLAIRDALNFETIMLSNLQNKALKNFSFVWFKLPKQPVCISGAFTYETSEEIIKIGIESDLTQIYFHFIPYNEDSIVIMGCENSKKEKVWDYILSHKGTEDESLKKISNLMINQLENWLCSPSYYFKKIKKIEYKIVNLTRLGHQSSNERVNLNFNLFE